MKLHHVLWFVAMAIILAGCNVCPPPATITTIGSPDADVQKVLAIDYPGCAWTGTVEWVDGPFDCDGRSVWGCYLPDACPEKIMVAHHSGALWHELGHACGTIAFD